MSSQRLHAAEMDKHEEKQKSKIKVHPRDKASYLSRLFFCWQLAILFKFYKKHINESNLHGTLRSHQTKLLGDRIEEAWDNETQTNKNPSLWLILRKVFGLECALCGFLVIIRELILKMAIPIFLGKLLTYYTLDQNKINKNEAYIYAILMVIMQTLRIFVDNIHDLATNHLAMKVRVACTTLIYRKSLKLSHNALTKTSVGQMINLLSNDVNKFDMGAIYFHYAWMGPLESLIMLYILYTYLGSTAIAGSVILITYVVVQAYIGKKITVYRMRTALKTDQRIRLMNEIIGGIKIIKMYTWEKPFALFLERARKLEMKHIKQNSYTKAFQIAFAWSLMKLATFFSILTYVLSGQKLSSTYVYVLFAFYEVIRVGLAVFFTRGILYVSEITTSVKRIQTFLTLPEFDQESTKTDRCNEIFLDGVSIQLDKSTNRNTLDNVTLRLKDNELVALIGPVGAGKSTILRVLLREIPAMNGTVQCTNSLAYSSQEPWLFKGSIRDNIVFGGVFEEKKYEEVLKICALEPDLSGFPYGDRTLVGEKGVMLSGGQKARINLARAVYKDAALYLLDDPLSAVDARVGNHIFKNCIKRYLENKPRILVTHHLQYLQEVDKIYLIENGQIVASGTYQELSKSTQYLNKLTVDRDKDENTQTISLENNNQQLEDPKYNEEMYRSGTISWKVYKRYFAKAGHFVTVSLTFFGLAVTVAAINGTNYYLAIWTNIEEQKTEDKPAFTYLYIYTALSILPSLFCAFFNVLYFKLGLNASRKLHNLITDNIMSVPMNFFYSNPSGRILNRFSKDLGIIDESISNSILRTSAVLIIVLVALVIICIINPWMVIPTLIMVIAINYFKKVYLYTSCNLRRIEAKHRSLVYSHISSSMLGLATIRSCNVQPFMKDNFEAFQDLHSSAYYLYIACDGCFGFWLDVICVVYVSLVTLSFLIIGSETHGANVGLSITQAITITGLLQFGMKQEAEMENDMISVERVLEYTKLEAEAEIDNAKKAPPSWPENGRIEFKTVSMRYVPEDPLVLKNVSFVIEPKEKIGIVGRTGAGKSSLVSVFFRLTQTDGDVLIDGLNIKTLSLESLRSKISIIPQDPFLFSGTIRSNLDPFEEYQDAQLWDALEKVELKSVVFNLPSGLASRVTEDGLNFSVGQRQLLCLARTLVRMNKILILDEATANVDFQTDELIQKTIRENFQECTILIIAHRIHTVMDCDKILVMDAGRVVEFDSVSNLLDNKDGTFFKLFQQNDKIQKDGN